MSIESWKIGSRDEWLARRQRNINASEAAALFGPKVHPYLTPLKLWNIKCEGVGDDEDTPTKKRGRLLEPVAIALLQEERPQWRICGSDVYFWDPETRMGATPDADAYEPAAGHGAIQIKSVGPFAWKRNWHTPEGEIYVPTWIAIQATVEAYLTGSAWAGVMALRLGDGGLDYHYVDIPLKMHLIRKIEALIADFWRLVEDHTPPAAELSQDRQLIMDMWAGDGSIIDLTWDEDFGGLVSERKKETAIVRAGERALERRKSLDARIVQRLGNASGALTTESVVNVKTIRKKAYQVKPQTYPVVRVKDIA